MGSQNDRIRKAARAYISAGYAVSAVDLALDQHGKKNPVFHGSWNDAITDPSRVDAVFATATGIAISTDASGIVVVDVDVSQGKDGYGNLEDAGIVVPATSMGVSTWSGGTHAFYAQPENPVGTGSNSPVRDVDFRGVGGVVFAAPSAVYNHEGGLLATYELIGPLLDVCELPVLPESYAALIRSRPRMEFEPAEAVDPALLRDDQRERIEQYISSDLHSISEAGPGQRNEALGKNVLNVVSRAQQLGLGYEETRDRVLGAYERSGGQDRAQALSHAESAWVKCLEQGPRAIPRTPIDEEADRIYSKLVATRIAKSRITGETSRLLTESSFVDWSVDPPEPQYWIDGVIPQGEQVVLYGDPEAGKTFLALDWAMSVATGRACFGRTTTPGRVLYMSGEGNARITSRMHAWMSFHGARPRPEQLLMTDHVPDLMNDQVIENLAREISRREIDLVIIDTLGRAMSIGGGDISSPPDTAQALKNMQVLSAYRPATTPVVIHHKIKSGTMAGSYNLLGGVDVALVAEVAEGETEGVLRFQKRKDGVKGEVCSYRWKESGRSAVLVPGSGSGYGEGSTL